MEIITLDLSKVHFVQSYIEARRRPHDTALNFLIPREILSVPQLGIQKTKQIGIINKGKRETQLYQVLKSKKNIFQIQSERINIATIFTDLSYKSLIYL